MTLNLLDFYPQLNLSYQNMKPMEKLSTFLRRLKISLSGLIFSSISMVVNPLDMLCKPYSKEKSKNTREILIPKPAIKLKLIG